MTPGLVRLWVLAALRRPGRGAVVVVALLVMTVASAGASVAADSLARLFVADAEAEWGEVDVEARPARNSVFDDATARFLTTRARTAAAGGAPRLVLPVAVTSAGRTESGLVLGLGPEESSFSPLRALRGSASPLHLQSGQALLNERLAERVAADVGDSISLVVGTPRWTEQRSGSSTPIVHPARAVHLELAVVGVLADGRAADLHRAPLVLMSRDALQQLVGLRGKSTLLHLRAARPTAEAADALVDELDGIAARTEVALETVRADALDVAHEEGGLFRSILLFLAALVLLAAAGGATALLASATQQRAPVVGLLRAQGLPAAGARGLVLAEAMAYAVVAIALGTLLALPAGSFVAGALADHFAALDAGRGRERVALEPTVSFGSLALAALFVLAAAGLSARAAAVRALPRDIESTLRGDPPPSRGPAGTARPAVALLAGGFALGMASAGEAPGAMSYIGISALLGAGWLATRRARDDPRRQRLDRTCALFALAWSVVGAVALGDMSQGVQAGFGVIVVAGGVTIVATCVLLTGHLRRAMRLVRVYAPNGPVQAALVVAAARAEAERDRSGVAVATVASAVFGLVALNVLGNIAQIPLARQDGGFDVMGTSVAAVDAAQLRQHVQAARLVAVPTGVVDETDFWVEDADANRSAVPYPVRLVGASPELSRAQAFGIADSLPEYPDARAALDAVALDGDKAVVDRRSRPEGSRPGDDVVLDTGSGPRRFQLVAILDTFLLGAVFLAESPLRDLGVSGGDNFVLAAVTPGGTAPALAQELGAAGRNVGLIPRTSGEIRDEVTAVNRTFTDVFAAVLGLAILVAVTSLSAGVLHSARRYRAALGTLRASGAGRAHAALALAAEPVFLSLLGIAVGLGAGLGVMGALFRAGFSDLPFVVDVPRLLAVLMATLVCVVVASAAMAWRSAQTPLDAMLHDLG